MILYDKFARELYLRACEILEKTYDIVLGNTEKYQKKHMILYDKFIHESYSRT
jgi:hypothetical protein